MRETRVENRPLYVIYKDRKGHLKDLEAKLDERSVRQLEDMGYIEITHGSLFSVIDIQIVLSVIKT